MTKEEFEAARALYRAAQSVCSIAGYRWARWQIDEVRERLTAAALALYPFLVAARDEHEPKTDAEAAA